MTTIEVVFVGLCALIFDDGMKSAGQYDNPGQPQNAKNKFEALLPRDDHHDPEMWVQCIDLEDGCAEAQGLGSCRVPADTCVEWTPGSVRRTSTCAEQADVYAVWCLEDTLVKFRPSNWSFPTYEAGYRPDPASNSRRFFGNNRPRADGGDRWDVSWVAEPIKAFDGGRLDPDHDATTRVVGLRGGLWTTEVPGKPLQMADIWGWCYPDYNGTVMTSCEPDPNRARDYDQTFAEAAAIDIKSGSARIVLEKDGNKNKIDLDKTHARPKVYIQNIPHNSDLKQSNGSGQAICVAEHFKHYADLLDGRDPADVPLPWRPIAGTECNPTPLDSSDMQLHFLTVSDSFCPPGGISRNP